MQFVRPTSSPAKTALTYITVGILMMVWTGVYWAYRSQNATDNDPVPYYWITGFMATGLALLVIGLGIGQIGRVTRQAEATPPAVVTAQPNVAPAPTPQAAANPVAANQLPPGQAPTNQVATNQTPASQPAPVAVAPAAGVGAAGQLALGSNNQVAGS